MPHFLVLIPSLDYEFLHEGTPDFEGLIVTATDSDHAILTRLNPYGDFPYEYDTQDIKSAAVLELADSYVQRASPGLINRLRADALKFGEEQAKAREIAELKRLMAKHAKEVM